MKTIPCEDCGRPVVYCDRHETWEHVEKGVSCFLSPAPCAFTLAETEVVSSKVLDAMQAKLDDLKAERDALKVKLDEANAEYLRCFDGSMILARQKDALTKERDALQAERDALEVTTPMLLTALEELMGAMGGEPPTEAIAIAWTQALTAIAHAKGGLQHPCDECGEEVLVEDHCGGDGQFMCPDCYSEFDRHEAEAFLAQDLQIARGE